jgi:hypothetical protein
MSDKFKITVQDYLEYENIYSSKIREFLSYEVSLFENFFDIQQKLFFNNLKAKAALNYILDENDQIIMQCYHKSINLLYIAHNLTTSGNYGAANSLLRQIFEFLIFGKYYFSNENDKTIRNWTKDGYIRITKQIFHQLTHKNHSVLESFWQEVSHFTHATKSAHQLNTHFKVDIENVLNTYLIILMLLRCNFHLLNTCIIDTRTANIIKAYESEEGEYNSLKIGAKEYITKIGKILNKDGSILVRSYIANWKTNAELT